MSDIFNFSNTMINWYHKHGRKKLPWQINKNIYKTWISEIMLQQTQVKTVIPYFKKFIKKFPNFKTLSKSSLDEILFIWSGLGFYNRAKNIYKTAQIIKRKYKNKIPKEFNTLIKFPGIGKSTAGALLSLTYNYYFPILDGNIKRVLRNFYNLKIKKTKLEKKIWKKLNLLIPIHNAQKFNQSMMDLGKKICKPKNPLCNICPLKKKCLFFINKKSITKKKDIKKKKKTIKKCWFLLKTYKNFYFLKKQKYNIWKNLYYFPIYFKKIKLKKKLKKEKITKKNKKIKPFLHQFNKYSLLIKTIIIKVKKKKYLKKKNGIWCNFFKMKEIGTPSPIKKIIKKYIKIIKKNNKKIK
ncbi:MAG: A/G-specific adenine glycosylase [Buchnera aphidicola (Periphyllus lyropictus)]|uniref:A/G-specific adenine glycosylase n=1 Tax=Buchnera aphidicola TaxID=9 RepID=UPI001EC0982A|nr:A/G-specific adenine glycosylase [Buchnera aphidicola]NIH16447.1 A/G-specific adenine glycosylase [Buchnera aphidicola (Periphyllus lyropictus)]USS94732.1 A/G-specific adenine glycosylase [Buchnera aphidicola (Periphyllus lyropictus)]